VLRARIGQATHSQLADPTKTLKFRGIDEIQKEFPIAIEGDQTVDVGGGVNVGWNGRFEIRMVRHG